MALDVYKDWLGIPEGERPPDHYTLLRCVRFEDDTDKIRANYKKLNAHVRKYATGQYATESQDLLNELAKAMLCLTDPVRKRDYDEALGREFEEDVDPLGRKPTDKVLVEAKHITREQAREVQEYAEARGLTFRDAVVQMKLVDQETAAKAYAVELGLPYVELADMLPDDAVLDRVPRHVVRHNSILPLFVDDGYLMVACVDMPTFELEEELRLRFEAPVRPVLATPRTIQQAIATYYAPGARDESAAEAASETESGSDAKATKQKSAKKAKPKPAASVSGKRMSQLSPEQKRERQLIGAMIICWIGLILPLLLENYVLFAALGSWPLLSPSFFPVGPITAVTAAGVTAWVVAVYWK